MNASFSGDEGVVGDDQAGHEAADAIHLWESSTSTGLSLCSVDSINVVQRSIPSGVQIMQGMATPLPRPAPLQEMTLPRS